MIAAPKEKVGAVIAAAGASQRMEGSDKIFAPLLGHPLISWTVEVFQNCSLIHQIVLVLSPGNLEQGKELVRKEGWDKVTDVCRGALRRQDSVAAGLAKLQSCRWTVIHDGARPCLTPDLLKRGLEAAATSGAAVAAVPAKDTIKVVGRDGWVQETPWRGELWAVQTPQVFSSDIIQQAHLHSQEDATDDASLVERMGVKVKVYMGSYDNIKVTTPEDLAWAEAVLRKRQHPYPPER